jgi:hypothetical protein
MKLLLIVTAVLEAGIGIGLLVVPSTVAQVLLGAPLEAPAALMVARVAGAALLAQSHAARGVVSVMVLYNFGAMLVLGAAGIQSHLTGIGLWPAVILHAVMMVWCVTTLLRQPGTLSQAIHTD